MKVNSTLKLFLFKIEPSCFLSPNHPRSRFYRPPGFPQSQPPMPYEYYPTQNDVPLYNIPPNFQPPFPLIAQPIKSEHEEPSKRRKLDDFLSTPGIVQYQSPNLPLPLQVPIPSIYQVPTPNLSNTTMISSKPQGIVKKIIISE